MKKALQPHSHPESLVTAGSDAASSVGISGPGSAGKGSGSLMGARGRRPVSALNEPVWRLCLIAVGSSLVGWLLHEILGPSSAFGGWLVALVCGLGWLAAIRMLLLDARFRTFWILWLGLGLVLLTLENGLNLARSSAVVFLLLRHYQPLRHLSSVRRARLFLLSLLCFFLLAIGLHIPDDGGGFGQFGMRLARYASYSLIWFWAMVLVQLALRARLHFLRLKPKLAVAGGFIALVPLVLVMVLGSLMLYFALGVRTADRGQEILYDWVELVREHPEAGNSLFGESFNDPDPLGAEPPFWTAQLREALRGQEGSARWAPTDTTAFFALGNELWVLQLKGAQTELPSLQGWRVDGTALDRLAKLLRGGVRIALKVESAGAMVGLENQEAGDILVAGTYHDSHAAQDSSGNFFRKPLFFGGSLIHAIELDDDQLVVDEYLLTVSARLEDVGRDFVSGSNMVGTGLVIALATLAFLFLLFELGALFFGLRIATGITSAVQTLDRGTTELAKGNLDVRIDVPNEDEFGDLAESFNDMTRAVKRGQEELLARERMERELQTAREIQRRLLPFAVPKLKGFQVAGHSEPSLQVGGDYYDFLPLPEHRLGVAVGDVSGKGIPAALLMSNLQASLKGQVLHPSSVSRTVEMVNQLLVGSTDVNMFATFFYGELDTANGDFTATNAGHDPPILCRDDGSIDRISTGGLVLGIMEGMPYEELTVNLRPGDVLVIYTDGITEAQGPLSDLPLLPVEERPAADDGSFDDEDDDDRVNLFDEERLIAVIQQNRHRNADEIQAAILTAVKRHAAGIPQSDDITLVVVKRELGEVQA